MSSSESNPPLREIDPELTRAPFIAPFERFLRGDGRTAESYDDSFAAPDTPTPFPPQGLREPRVNACC